MSNKWILNTQIFNVSKQNVNKENSFKTNYFKKEDNWPFILHPTSKIKETYPRPSNYKLEEMKLPERITPFLTLLEIQKAPTKTKGEAANLRQINVEEEGLFGIRDLDTILFVRIWNIDVVYTLRDGFHCREHRLMNFRTLTSL